MSVEIRAQRAEFDRFVVENPDIVEIDAFIIDVNGNALGKRLPVERGGALFESGIAFSACAPLLDARGRGHDPAGLGQSDGDPDATVLPLPGTICRVPWAHAPTAQVLCSMCESATQMPLWFDPRVILREVVEKLVARGLRPVVACELEFYLIERARGSDGQLRLAPQIGTSSAPRRPMNLSLEHVEDNASFLAQVGAAAKGQNVPLAGSVAEYGVGQYEINLRHTPDALLAADHAVLLKRLVRGTARAHGMDATFIAKPFLDQPGSGLHVHVSLLDDNGSNRFAAADGEKLLRNAIAGMQALMFDSSALFAPNFNSHRRFNGPFVPTAATWGYNNRSVAFRVPAAAGPDLRIEHRVAGADASPHLVTAAVLAGILHGVCNDLSATPPIMGRAPPVPDPAFPRGLFDALTRLEHSELLATYIPTRYLQAYAHLKRGEFNALFAEISARELDFYA